MGTARNIARTRETFTARETKMGKEMIGVALAFLSLASGAAAQNQSAATQDEPMKLKGGHVLGETAEQFFAEGHEKEALERMHGGRFQEFE